MTCVEPPTGVLPWSTVQRDGGRANWNRGGSAPHEGNARAGVPLISEYEMPETEGWRFRRSVAWDARKTFVKRRRGSRVSRSDQAHQQWKHSHAPSDRENPIRCLDGSLDRGRYGRTGSRGGPANAHRRRSSTLR